MVFGNESIIRYQSASFCTLGNMTTALTHLLSATQIKLWQECKRYWAWQYLAGIKTPQHPAAALGVEVDEGQLQPYFRDGRPFDFTRESGYIAASGLEFLPRAPQPPGRTQKHFVLPSASAKAGEEAPFAYQGYIDLWMPDEAVPLVIDFKTTGYLSRAKTVDQLANDVQANLYATWAMYETKAREVDLRWVYLQTKGAKKAKSVQLRVDAAHVLRQFQAIDAIGQEIMAAKACAPEQDVDAYVLTMQPTLSACSAWGGCPHLQRCQLGNAQEIDAISGPTGKDTPDVETSELLEKMRARKAARLGAQPVAENTPVASVVQQAPIEQQKPACVGINPPEKDLPPPPLVLPEPEAPKAKRGRLPRKTSEEVVPANLEKTREASAEIVGTAKVIGNMPQNYTLENALIAAAEAFLDVMKGKGA